MTITYCPVTKEPIFDDPSEFLVNTAHFRPADLELFIESMEILTRIERKRYEENQQKLRPTKQQELSAMVNAAEAQIELRIIDEPATHLEAKTVEEKENVMEIENVSKNEDQQQLISKDSVVTSARSNSPTQVNNVFSIGEPQKLSDNNPVRPRSVVISKSKRISSRAKLISMAVKRQRERSKMPTKMDLSFEEIATAVKRCERAMAEASQRKYMELSKQTKSSSSSTSGTCGHGYKLNADAQDKNFLIQALRLLTF